MNRASMLIDAAVDGQGIALARTTLAAGDLISGRLVRPFADVLRQFNARNGARPRKWVIFDGDANGGGVVPYEYRADDFYNAVQWAAGLELFLLIDDPWRTIECAPDPLGCADTFNDPEFPELERQMCDFAADGLSNGKSPDRLDALVWALTELMLTTTRTPLVRPL